MTENKSILVINGIINKVNITELQSYLSNISLTFGKYGGKPIARYKTVQQLTGSESPELIALIEFPNTEIINEMINSEEFGSLAESRAKVFSKLNIMICNEL